MLQRLVERQAAAKAELLAQQQRLIRAQAQLAALDRKRQALLGPEDRERVQARIHEAEVAVTQAETQLRQIEIRAPTDGVLYFLALKPGGYYDAGALVGRVGIMHSVRVRLLVDEPELGPVQVGQPVRITWDALPGTSWQGTVERLPAMVETVGTRTVGEVICTIDTPLQRLLPNVTVNVEIRTGAADNAVTIPREAVVREGEQTLVLVVDADGVIARRRVRLGIHDLARVQVLEGLNENQIVVLPGERSFSAGQKVRPKVAT
ncbi:MAG: efflux RND transporter periplasmic adaptor subunit [Acidobacteria bacterium]|nr:efflux RND transporter periplasmic adaptor subunit [Acidobacteriota bacterium]